MKTFFLLLFIGCLVLGGIYYYFDGFEDLELSKSRRGPFLIVYQKIDPEDSRLNYLLDNLLAYLEREKNIDPQSSFQYSGPFPGKKGDVHIQGFLLQNEVIKGKLRKDIKIKTIIPTTCLSGKFTYKNNISKMIFENIKLPEFYKYIETNKLTIRQKLIITNKSDGLIEIITPEFEWKIQ